VFNRSEEKSAAPLMIGGARFLMIGWTSR